MCASKRDEEKIFVATGRSGYVIGPGGVRLWYFFDNGVLTWEFPDKVTSKQKSRVLSMFQGVLV